MILRAVISLVVMAGMFVLAELGKALIEGKNFSLPSDFLLLLAAAVVGSVLVGEMKAGRR